MRDNHGRKRNCLLRAFSPLRRHARCVGRRALSSAVNTQTEVQIDRNLYVSLERIFT